MEKKGVPMERHEELESAGNGDWSARENVARGIDSVAATLGGLDRRVRPHIDAHPFVAVGFAVAVGWVLGRLISRS
jgi:ElaB/YqjD/DUF883 family membrane-anchored ribosome-binding protein